MRTFSRGALVGVLLALITGGAAVGQPPSPIPPPVPGTPSPAPTPVIVPASPPVMPPRVTPAKSTEPPTAIDGKSIEAWIGEFKSNDPTVRERAVKVMHGFGREAVRKAASKPLLKMLDDTDPGVRINAILVVGAVGFDKVEDVREAAGKLAATIGNTAKGSVIRLHAARTLAGFGTEGHEAIPALLKLVDDSSWETRAAVAAALGRVGAAAYDAVYVADGPVVVKVPKPVRPPNETAMSTLHYRLIRDASAAVRAEACQALVVMGPPRPVNPAEYAAKAGPYVKTIGERLAVEKDAGVKIWLQLLIVMYDDRQTDAALKSLGNQVAGGDPRVRLQALHALAYLGPKARPALESVASVMRQPDADTYLVAGAIATIMSMGAEAKAGIADLEQLEATTKNADLKKMAAEALKILKKGRPAPVPAAVATPVAEAKQP